MIVGVVVAAMLLWSDAGKPWVGVVSIGVFLVLALDVEVSARHRR